MKPDQLLYQIIRPALAVLGTPYNSPAAAQLLLATAAQETHCGEYVHQVHGPAHGIYQMETPTLHSLYDGFLSKHANLAAKIGPRDPGRLIYDLRYATLIARMDYYQEPARLPAEGDMEGMWHYYKTFWNSLKGAATRVEFVDNWHRYVQPVYVR